MSRPDFPLNEAGEPILEGLVLRTIDYKDHDGIIHLASPDGIWSFYARGIQKDTSHNRRLSVPFSRVSLQYDPRYSNSLLFLIHGSIRQSYWKNAESLELQSVNAILVSLLERHSITPFSFRHLEAGWKAGQENDLNGALKEACLVLADILRQSGTLMDVSECAVCQKRQTIAGISLEAGGFVCRDHLDPTASQWPARRLLQLRRLVQAVSLPDFPFERLDEFEWDLAFFIYLADWYVYQNDAPVRSLDFLKSLA